MSTGQIVQIIGAVVDVKFSQEAVPKVWDALTVDEGQREGAVLEVQQILGGGIVRTIIMETATTPMGDSSELILGQNILNTGEPINVPVDINALGRIMNVLGQPIK